MKVRRLSQNGAISLSLLFAAGAFAQDTVQVAKADKWALFEQTLADGSVVCIARTSKKEKKSNYSFEIHKIKNSAYPMEIILQESGPAQVGGLVKRDISKERVLLARTAQGKDSTTYWMLPDEMAQVESDLRRNKDFELKPVFKDKIGDIGISAKGAGKMIDAMQDRCNYRTPMPDARLAEYTDHPVAFDAKPQILSVDQTSGLREIYFQMAEDYRNLLTAEDKLSVIIERYRPVVTEARTLTSERNQLENARIPQTEISIEQAQATIASSRIRLEELSKSIPPAEGSVAAAQRAFDVADARLSPIYGEYQDLTEDARLALQSLNAARADLNATINEINGNDLSLRNHHAEAIDITARQQRVRQQINDAREAVKRTKETLDRFDRQTVIDERINRHVRRGELIKLIAASSERVVERNKARIPLIVARDAAVESLKECQKTVGADCSATQATLDAAHKIAVDHDKITSDLVTTADRNEKEKAQIEKDIVQNVNERAQDLRRNYEQAYRDQESLENSLQSLSERRRILVQVEIPRLESRNQYLFRARREQERIANDRADNYETASSTFVQFKNRTGIETLIENYSAARENLDSAAATLNTLTSNKTNSEVAIRDNETRVMRLTAELATARARSTVITARLAQLETSLGKFADERAPFDAEIENLNVMLNSKKVAYMSTLQFR